MRIIEENIEEMNKGYRMVKEFRWERHFSVQSYHRIRREMFNKQFSMFNFQGSEN
jgi:hypothetical protein